MNKYLPPPTLAGNLPGTIATISDAIMAVSQTKKVIDLLDLAVKQKTKFRNLANNREALGARSASKVFKGAIRIVSNALGARGTLGFLISNSIGMFLAIGPQGYLDWASSAATVEFKRKSFYSQPTNIASFVAGWGTSILIGFVFGTSVPLLLVIAASAVVGLLVQKSMSYYEIDHGVGGYYTK